MEKKKPISFGTFETKKDAFIEYQRKLSFSERFKYLKELRQRAYGKKLNIPMPKKIEIHSIKEGESEEEFFKRVFK